MWLYQTPLPTPATTPIMGDGKLHELIKQNRVLAELRAILNLNMTSIVQRCDVAHRSEPM
jgi:hypothetical protein